MSLQLWRPSAMNSRTIFECLWWTVYCSWYYLLSLCLLEHRSGELFAFSIQYAATPHSDVECADLIKTHLICDFCDIWRKFVLNQMLSCLAVQCASLWVCVVNTKHSTLFITDKKERIFQISLAPIVDTFFSYWNIFSIDRRRKHLRTSNVPLSNSFKVNGK